MRSSAAASSSSSGTRCRCGAASGASTANTTSCAPRSPTAATCRASRRSASAAASTSATPNGSRASACCTRFAQNDIAIIGETPTGSYNLLKVELSHSRELKNHPSGIKQFTVGVVGNNLLNEDIRNHVSYSKDFVLMPGAGVRAFASVKY